MSNLTNNTAELNKILAAVNALPEAGGNAVQYVPQELTEEQKAQARENIGAVTVADVLAAIPIGEGVRY